MSTRTADQIPNQPQAVTCPPWCDGEHNADSMGNFFHRGPLAVVAVPEAAAVPTVDKDAKIPNLTAHLVLPEGPEFSDEPPQITVDAGDLWGPYAELDLEHADQFIRDLKAFTARAQQMRDQLAALKGQQS